MQLIFGVSSGRTSTLSLSLSCLGTRTTLEGAGSPCLFVTATALLGRLQLQFLYFFLDKVWGRFLQRGIRRDEHPEL